MAQSAGSEAKIDTSGILINEILYNPGRRTADEESTLSSFGEFVEFVNISDKDIDISGWMLSNRSEIKFTFPEGTVISAGKTFVVAESASNISSGGAYLFSVGSLGLNDEGDDIILSDGAGNIISSIAYGGLENGESITRSPDLSGSFESHATADSGDDSSPFSPGTKIDGRAFGSTYAIGFGGNAGWRFVATPTQNTSFDDLFSGIWTQGIPGSDAPSISSASANIYSYSEAGGGAYNVIGSMSDNLSPGQGYLVFVYEDDDYRAPGIQGGFPKTVNTDKRENGSPVSITVTANDADNSGSIDNNEGYTLLGNPYGTDLSVTAVLDALEAADPSLNHNLYVWDNSHGSGNGEYITLGVGELLAPFQAFFVRYTSPGVNENVDLIRNNLAQKEGAEFHAGENAREMESGLNFKLYMGDGQKFDTYTVRFGENGQIGEDKYDGYKLFSLNAEAINFYSVVGEDVLLAKNMLPDFSALEGGEELRITLGYTIPSGGEYTFRWDLPEQLPADMELYLIDNQTGREINMRAREAYSAEIVKNETRQANAVNKATPVLSSQAYASANNGRFELKVVRAQQQAAESEPMEKPVVLSPNYPNPFDAQTRMDLDLQERMHVKVTIWNIVGQRVATMHDGIMDAGLDHPLIWNVPANMPSGIYICKVEAGGTVITRKMTLVK